MYFYSLAPNTTINTCANIQHCCPFSFGKNWRFFKQSSFKFKQGHLGLFVEKRDHDYCGVRPRNPQQRNRFSVTDSERCKRVDLESGSVLKNL